MELRGMDSTLPHLTDSGERLLDSRRRDFGFAISKLGPQPKSLSLDRNVQGDNLVRVASSLTPNLTCRNSSLVIAMIS